MNQVKYFLFRIGIDISTFDDIEPTIDAIQDLSKYIDQEYQDELLPKIEIIRGYLQNSNVDIRNCEKIYHSLEQLVESEGMPIILEVNKS